MSAQTSHQFELISFKLCPFVQRAVIALNWKKADFKITYIDLSHPPDWFLKISPMGQVPVLKVDNEHVIFESAVICELLDELIAPQLNLKEPIARAKERAWIEYGSSCLGEQAQALFATEKDEAEEKQKELFESLARLEHVVSGSGPYFRGKDFSFVDATYAPLFMRLQMTSLFDQALKSSPRTRAWALKLLDLKEVKESVVPTFKEEFFKYLEGIGSAFIKTQ